AAGRSGFCAVGDGEAEAARETEGAWSGVAATVVPEGGPASAPSEHAASTTQEITTAVTLHSVDRISGRTEPPDDVAPLDRCGYATLTDASGTPTNPHGRPVENLVTWSYPARARHNSPSYASGSGPGSRRRGPGPSRSVRA